MADLGKLTRREFLRKSLRRSIAAGIGGSMGLSFLDQILMIIKGFFGDVSPITEQKPVNPDESNDGFSGKILDTTIEDIPFKLYGVRHDRAFAEAHYSTIDQLVYNSSIIVMETHPYVSSRINASNDFISFFGTIVNLCQKYDKPIVAWESLSVPALAVDYIIGAFSGAYALDKSNSLMKDKLTRRQFAIDTGKFITASYLFVGSLFGIPLRLTKPFFFSDLKSPQYAGDDAQDREKY